MDSTFTVLLKSNKKYAKIYGGNYLKAYKELKKIIKKGNNLSDNIEKLVNKHDINSQTLGGHYLDFISILKKFIK